MRKKGYHHRGLAGPKGPTESVDTPHQVRRSVVLLLSLVVACAAATAAHASQLIDRNANDVSLSVNDKGEALITYTAGGRVRHVLAWGAVNAIAPTPSRQQVAFHLDYAGGWGKYHRDYWKTFGGSCGAYDGPPLAWQVLACKAPDGSYGGTAVYGYRSTSSGAPLDTFGRNVYVDTFDSQYGPGWHRENSFLTHTGTGAFCYSFNPHGAHPAGKGLKYRATVEGPGVTPDVMWEGVSPGSYSRAADAQANTAIANLDDRQCKPN